MLSSTARTLPHLVGASPLPGAVHLPHEPLSAGVARGVVRDLLTGWQSEDRVQDALLLTTEVVSNAIMHGRPDIRLRARLVAPDRVRIEVYDTSPNQPRLRAAWAGGGRGLAIVDETAHGWGVRPEVDGGKTVWFELLA